MLLQEISPNNIKVFTYSYLSEVWQFVALGSRSSRAEISRVVARAPADIP